MASVDLPPRGLEIARYYANLGCVAKTIVAGATHPVQCPNCNDTGIVTLVIENRPSNNPAHGYVERILPESNCQTQYREDFPCPRCQDFSVLRDRLWKYSGLIPSEREWRIDYCAGMPGKEIAVMAAQNLLGGLPGPTGMAYFYGGFGTGKTGILKATVAQSIRSDVPAIYVRAYDILLEIRSTFQEKSIETESTIIHRLAEKPLLAIDEVDRINESDWSMVTLQNLLDLRYSQRFNVATLFASNRSPELLGEGWEYLISRLKDAKRVPIGGVDLRGY